MGTGSRSHRYQVPLLEAEKGGEIIKSPPPLPHPADGETGLRRAQGHWASESQPGPEPGFPGRGPPPRPHPSPRLRILSSSQSGLRAQPPRLKFQPFPVPPPGLAPVYFQMLNHPGHGRVSQTCSPVSASARRCLGASGTVTPSSCTGCPGKNPGNLAPRPRGVTFHP